MIEFVRLRASLCLSVAFSLMTASAAGAAEPFGAQHQFDAATAALVAERWEEAFKRFSTLEARVAQSGDRAGLAVIRIRLGEALLRLERRDEAERMLLDGLEHLPEHQPTLQEDRALGLLALAQIDRGRGDRAKAAARYREAERAAPSPILKMRAIHGIIRVTQSDSPGQAVREADRGIALARSAAPDNPTLEAEFRSAKVGPLARLRRYKEARAEAKLAFEMFPSEFKDRLTFPRDVAAALIGPSNYDLAALAAREQGDVRIKYELASDGRISECRVKDAGKSALLASLSCPYLLKRSPLSGGVVEALRKTKDAEEMVLRWRLPLESATGPVETGRATKLWVDPLISDRDYPSASISAREEGAAKVSLVIRDDGTVAGCTIEESSGYPRLDSRSCEIMMRSVFLPAIDDSGRRMAATQKSRVAWRIPRLR